jgi:hypothetical protein
MRFNRLILALSMSAVLAFGQAKKDGEQPNQNHKQADSGGKNEGIKVHGHWVLETKNPDGSLASRREFENALVTSACLDVCGNVGMARLLTGQYFATEWIVALAYTDSACQQNPQSCSNCPSATLCGFISLQQFSCTGVPLCGPLTVGLNGDSTALVLTGTSAPVVATGTISLVRTVFFNCPLSSTPTACFENQPGIFFTAANTNLTIQPGQAVSVTVTISFS